VIPISLLEQTTGNSDLAAANFGPYRVWSTRVHSDIAVPLRLYALAQSQSAGKARSSEPRSYVRARLGRNRPTRAI
jgi:hypothetical protein